MLKLAREQILLGQSVATKSDAIALLAGKLTEAGLVEAGYVDGMLAREAQHATYLGSGIAIPHGTTDTRHLVKSTGVMVAQFPHGIEWDEGQIAYVAIGIAAKSDEHLGILRQLTHVLGDEQAAAQLKEATDADTIINILTGATAVKEVQYLSLADFPADDRDQLLLGAAARAKSAGWGDAAMVSALLASDPAYLGEGVWLARAQAAQTGWVLATPSSAITAGELPVSAMLLLCAADSGHLPQLENLAKLAAAGQLATLAGGEGLAMLLAGPASGLSENLHHHQPSRPTCPSRRHAGQGGQRVCIRHPGGQSGWQRRSGFRQEPDEGDRPWGQVRSPSGISRRRGRCRSGSQGDR